MQYDWSHLPTTSQFSNAKITKFHYYKNTNWINVYNEANLLLHQCTLHVQVLIFIKYKILKDITKNIIITTKHFELTKKTYSYMIQNPKFFCLKVRFLLKCWQNQFPLYTYRSTSWLSCKSREPVESWHPWRVHTHLWSFKWLVLAINAECRISSAQQWWPQDIWI